MIETLEKQKIPLPLQPKVIGSRAVALCEGCSLAAVCATKPVAECPQGVDLGDGGPLITPEAAVQSYKADLMNAAKPSVSAIPVARPQQPERKKIVPPPRPVTKKKVVQKPQVTKKAPAPRKGVHVVEIISETIADIFAAAVSVKGMAQTIKLAK